MFEQELGKYLIPRNSPLIQRANTRFRFHKNGAGYPVTYLANIIMPTFDIAKETRRNITSYSTVNCGAGGEFTIFTNDTGSEVWDLKTLYSSLSLGAKASYYSLLPKSQGTYAAGGKLVDWTTAPSTSPFLDLQGFRLFQGDSLIIYVDILTVCQSVLLYEKEDYN